ncbi:DUF3040 domain-containing protein, partial [Kitasatospora sp. NPDC058263]
MDGPALSGRERRLLEEIESDLRQDARLNRRLSTMGVKQPGRVRGGLSRLWHRLPAGVVMTALVMSAICLSIGVRTPTVPVRRRVRGVLYGALRDARPLGDRTLTAAVDAARDVEQALVVGDEARDVLVAARAE